MPPKTNRVNKKGIDLIFKEGKFINSPNLTFKFILNHGGVGPKISFITPKSVAKLAVRRNFLRRLGYRALKKEIKRIPKDLMGVLS